MPTSPRADARRNRASVLAAAERLFADQGLEVPLDAIARDAGVGAGTVYRHFPTKDALLEAVMTRRVEQLNERIAAALRRDDPATAFYDFLDHALRAARVNAALCATMFQHRQWRDAAGADPRHRYRESFARLVHRAQAAGAVRDDLDAADVAALIPGFVTMAAHRADEAGADRLLMLLWDGLRSGGASTRNTTRERHETRNTTAKRNETRERSTIRDSGPGPDSPASSCPVCGAPVATAATGRPATYCGAACRQKAHRRRGSASSPRRVPHGG